MPVISKLEAMRLPEEMNMRGMAHVDKDLHCLQYPGSYIIGFAQVESNDSNRWLRFDDGMTANKG